MTQEKIEALAKAATDSYFANLNENQKRALTTSPDTYIKAYVEVYAQTENFISNKYKQNLNPDMAKFFK